MDCYSEYRIRFSTLYLCLPVQQCGHANTAFSWYHELLTDVVIEEPITLSHQDVQMISRQKKILLEGRTIHLNGAYTMSSWLSHGDIYMDKSKQVPRCTGQMYLDRRGRLFRYAVVLVRKLFNYYSMQ